MIFFLVEVRCQVWGLGYGCGLWVWQWGRVSVQDLLAAGQPTAASLCFRVQLYCGQACVWGLWQCDCGVCVSVQALLAAGQATTRVSLCQAVQPGCGWVWQGGALNAGLQGGTAVSHDRLSAVPSRKNS